MAKEYKVAISANHDGFKNVAHVYDADDFRLAPDYKFSDFTYVSEGAFDKKNGTFVSKDGRKFKVFRDRSALELPADRVVNTK